MADGAHKHTGPDFPVRILTSPVSHTGSNGQSASPEPAVVQMEGAQIGQDQEKDTKRLQPQSPIGKDQFAFTKPRKFVKKESVTSYTQKFLFGDSVSDSGRNNCRNKSFVNLLSSLYGIILFILGMAFPLAQVISSRIPHTYYEGFYLYLYFVAIAFLIYTFAFFKNPPESACTLKEMKKLLPAFIKSTKPSDGKAADCQTVVKLKHADSEEATRSANKCSNQLDPPEQILANYGSFYLRMGAVVFGVGGMIYSGLDFGQYLDLNSDRPCYHAIIALSPASRVVFTFLQMYFVFLNAKVQIVKLRSPKLAQFGLMHILATNMCIWLNIIIEETMHEIHLARLTADGAHGHEGTAHHSDDSAAANMSDFDVQHWNHSKVMTSSLYQLCPRTELMRSLVESASPFLFPCAIEYSLICAATAYEIWSDKVHAARSEVGEVWDNSQTGSLSFSRQQSLRNSRRSPHHYSVDCTKANKGLFFGIFVLVFTIIAMILFSVLINRDDYKSTAITEVHVAELVLYCMMLISVIIGMIQVRQLRFDDSHTLNLEEVLIIVAQCGNIAYSLFTILGSQFSDHPDKLLVMMTSLTALIQGIAQTIFILDAYKRTLFTKKQQRHKPGREIVTFLLVTNFAMWAMTTMEKSRTDAHPVQSDFYGMWQWAIITNISTPLAIFYRYHSTVCLCEIWKHSYKVRDDLY